MPAAERERPGGRAGGLAGRGLVRLLACAALVLSAGGASGQTAPEKRLATEHPQRIVSLNLCADQLLLQMVGRERIRAVTYLARDPRSSGMAAAAMRVPVTRGTAEEVIAMKPDLVLAGAFSTRGTVAILRRLGYRVVEFEPETDFTMIAANIRKLAAAVGEPARGQAMIGIIERRLAEVARTSGTRPRPLYADYNANGYTSGDGMLISEVANRAGFDTLGQRLGFAGPRQVSLEQMLVLRPEIIDPGDEYAAPALATQMFRHPALKHLMRKRQVVAIPSKYTVCGTMQTLRALDALVAARRALP